MRSCCLSNHFARLFRVVSRTATCLPPNATVPGCLAEWLVVAGSVERIGSAQRRAHRGGGGLAFGRPPYTHMGSARKFYFANGLPLPLPTGSHTLSRRRRTADRCSDTSERRGLSFSEKKRAPARVPAMRKKTARAWGLKPPRAIFLKNGGVRPQEVDCGC